MFCGEDMEIHYFQIIDLGTGRDGEVGWGISHDARLDSDVLGVGDTAKAAFNDALDLLAIDGLGTRLLSEAGIEAGFLSQSACEPCASYHEDEDEDEEGDDSTDDDVVEVLDPGIRYHVLVRYEDPRP